LGSLACSLAGSTACHLQVGRAAALSGTSPRPPLPGDSDTGSKGDTVTKKLAAATVRPAARGGSGPPPLGPSSCTVAPALAARTRLTGS
jgi:hypothetical protein